MSLTPLVCWIYAGRSALRGVSRLARWRVQRIFKVVWMGVGILVVDVPTSSPLGSVREEYMQNIEAFSLLLDIL
jgi:hypothetical protein